MTAPKGKAIADKTTVSDWLTVDQRMVNAFAEVTLDPDPMHINPEWASKHSPFGATVAFGFLTLSLLTHLIRQVPSPWQDDSEWASAIALNYGFEKVRFVEPVPVGARIRGRFVVANVRQRNGEERLTSVDFEIEIEGVTRPAAVGRWLGLWLKRSVKQGPEV